MRNNFAFGAFFAAVFAFGAAFTANAGTGNRQAFDEAQLQQWQERDLYRKPLVDDSSFWSVAFDNDILVPGGRDQDYTYGFNATLKGEKATAHWLSLHRPLSRLDHWLGVSCSPIVSSKIEYGVYGFTPEVITESSPIYNDRPYAGLIYTSSSQEYIDPRKNVNWSSTLTLGVLGSRLVGDIQEQVHSVTGSKAPKGWNNQISDGGELTARYTVSRQHHITDAVEGVQVKSTVQASVGYITEAAWSIGGRIGKVHSDWVSFSPELASYGEKSSAVPGALQDERYFWAGIAVKARAYNAFLQGQFRISEVEYDDSELNHGILEAWAGYTIALKNGYRFTYSLRGHTSELKQGQGNRAVLWGGFQVSKLIESISF